MTPILAEAAVTSVPRRSGMLRVLVVEDHADCADSMAQLLRLYGHEVEVARNGPTALALAQTRPPDVVLLDIGLPGMSGYEVARELQEHRGTQKPLIIAISGFGRDADRRCSAESGIDLHLVKPADPNQLEDVLGRFQRLIHDRSV